jgi:hypothetical protein
MIQDGVSYLEIIDNLGPEGRHLTENNLSTWKAGGYVDWQRARNITEAIQAKYEFAVDMLEDAKDGNDPGRAILHVIATNLCSFLAETDPTTIRETLLADSDKFTRFVNSMVRLAEGGIKCEMHKFHAQDRSTEIANATTPPTKPGISEHSLHTAEESLKIL